MRSNITATDLLLFTESWLMLAAARLVLIWVPFRKIAPLLGKNITGTISPSDNKMLPGRQQQISTAIKRASIRAPWRTACFEQAITARMMLKSRKVSSITFFGVHKNNGHINAHAWLESEGVIVTGKTNFRQYTIIASFKS